MSENATEIVYIPMKPGLDLSTDEAKETWESTLSTIAKQPGAKALYWGRQIENPDTVQMAVEWESIEDHRTFEKTPGYQPFLAPIMDKLASGDDPTIFHINFPTSQSGSDNPFTMPVTECINAFFAPDYNQEEYSSQFSTFRTMATEIPNVEAKGVIGGWSVEPQKHESLGEGVDGKLFAAFIGWPSVDAHMEFRKTEDFGKLIPHPRGGPKGMKVWHVAFQQYK